MRAWRTKRRVVSLVENGWMHAPAPVRRAMGLVEGIASSMHGVLSASTPVSRIEIPAGVRILSIGAVSWGGDGKTPLADHLARRLTRDGLRVTVVTRHPTRRRGRSARVAYGPLQERRRDVSLWGDEAVMLASRSSDVHVWSGPRRRLSILASLAEQPDVVVVDDGLSLRGVRKDLEIALLSSRQTCLARIPAGPLRRPARDTARADIVGIQVGLDGQHLESEARRLLSSCGARQRPWFGFRLEPAGGSPASPVYLASGIARPWRFEAAVRETGGSVAGSTWYPDHHVPDERDLCDLARAAEAAGARCVLVTAKDAPRFPASIRGLPVAVFETRVRVTAHEDVLRDALERRVLRDGVK